MFLRQCQNATELNAVKRHRTLRHPGLIKYIANKSSEKGNYYITEGVCLVTEKVSTLTDKLPDMSEDQICLGLYSILSTLRFIHGSGLIHGDLRLDSIFCRDVDNSWLLGNFEFICEISNIDENYLTHFKTITNFEYPDNGADWGDHYNRDFYCVGTLIQTLQPYLKKKHLNWDSLNSLAENMMHGEYSLNDVIQCDFFSKNALIQVMPHFLLQIRALPHAEKKSHFQ